MKSQTISKELVDYYSNWYIAESKFKWYPDLFFDTMRPEHGGIDLNFDQRVFLRAIARFFSMYGTMPRGWSKTFLEVLANFHACIFYPKITIPFTAQTKENAAALLWEKYQDIKSKYPFIANEIEKESHTTQSTELWFKNGSRIYTIANAQSSKGRDGHRMTVEESAQLKAALFEDVLEPIVNRSRLLQGSASITDPMELNHKIDFFTTSWYRSSDEFTRSNNMLESMAKLECKIVIGADWRLACYYGRGKTKNEVLKAKANSTKVFFDMNYNSKWVGASDGALIDIQALMSSQIIETPEWSRDERYEYVVGVDVARSDNSNNCQTSISVGKIKRKPNNRIDAIELVNLFTLSGTLNFTQQAIEIKRTYKRFTPLAVIVDANGVGKGLVDELLKEQEDVDENGVPFKWACFDTLNSDSTPDNPNDAIRCVYDLKVQGVNSDIISNFMNVVDNGILKLLAPLTSMENSKTMEYSSQYKMPFIHTKLFIDEVTNLKYQITGKNKQLTVVPVTKGVPKDRYSAVAYMAWYIMTFEDNSVIDLDDDAGITEWAMVF